ncbi:MAG: hypothetical protein AAF330_02290, partial [Pseudomonadota bacterium]
GEQVRQMANAQVGLQKETAQLVRALRQPSGRGLPSIVFHSANVVSRAEEAILARLIVERTRISSCRYHAGTTGVAA